MFQVWLGSARQCFCSYIQLDADLTCIRECVLCLQFQDHDVLVDTIKCNASIHKMRNCPTQVYTGSTADVYLLVRWTS